MLQSKLKNLIVIYGAISLIFIIILVRKTSFKFSKKEILTILAFFALNATYSLNTALGKVIGSEFYHVEEVGGLFFKRSTSYISHSFRECYNFNVKTGFFPL